MTAIVIIIGIIVLFVLAHFFFTWLNWSIGVRDPVYYLDLAIERSVKLSSDKAIIQFEDARNPDRFIRFYKRNPSRQRGFFEMELPNCASIELLAERLLAAHQDVKRMDSDSTTIRMFCDRNIEFAKRMACTVFSEIWNIRPEDEYRMRHRGGMAWPRLKTGEAYWDDRF